MAQTSTTQAYHPPPEMTGGPSRRPLVVVGAGPVGLAAAIDAARRGLQVLLLDQDDAPASGSRAICWSKRTLEIFDRLGVAGPMLERGITWKVGRIFHHDRQLHSFDLLPEPGHRMPAFINLQQYHVEQTLIDQARSLPGLEMRWRNRVVGVTPDADGVAIEVETPDGVYGLTADWLLACDGARSTIRHKMQLPFVGQVFQDRFLIADVHMNGGFPTERWFWFDPPFHPGQSALLHRQADDIFRIDLQLGWYADPEIERQPKRVLPRLRAMLGPDCDFTLEWVSVYTFQCRRLERFRHGRVLFAGDSAHQVSPFGARGGNGGVQDADNLIWKLALVIRGLAPEGLLDSYDDERILAADENIRQSTRSTGFISPKGPGALVLRDAVLQLAADLPFARNLINSGRLSVPCVLTGSDWLTPDGTADDTGAGPGEICPDAPLRGADGKPGWLGRQLGPGFTLILFCGPEWTVPAGDCQALLRHRAGLAIVLIRDAHAPHDPADPPAVPVWRDVDGLARQRLGRAGAYLVRPDHHIAGRWPGFDRSAIERALARAIGARDCGPPATPAP